MNTDIAESSSSKLNNLLITVMAVSAAGTVANMYYMQPLLADIAATFKVTQTAVGINAMVTQIGYASGLIFILPLGDIWEKRKLIIIMLLCSVASLISMYMSNNMLMLAVSSFAVGFTSIIPQLMMPFAVQMSDPAQRGEVIGKILSGLLIGILLSRSLSGLLGEYFSWRAVYLIAAIMMVILIAALIKLLPICMPTSNIRYTHLLGSMKGLIKSEPILRRKCINGAMMFASFSTFWTSLIFLIKSPHFNMGAKEAGMFGLVGISGALAAPMVGKISDKRGSEFVIGICIACVTASYMVFLFLGFKIWGLVLGIILLDLGVQSSNVCNQAMVQALNGEARNRLQSIYMASFFLGGALGSFLGALIFAHFGWRGVCFIGIAYQLIAILVHKFKKVLKLK